MTDKLPLNLLALFAPRPGLRFLHHGDHPLEQRHTTIISGVGGFLDDFEEYKKNDKYVPTESWLQKRDRVKVEKKEETQQMLTEGIKNFNPSEDPQIRGDPFRTLFVSRLSYDTEAKDLEREFSRFGPIERIRLVTNTHADEDASRKKKNRGYAFIVYEREKDMKSAYNCSDHLPYSHLLQKGEHYDRDTHEWAASLSPVAAYKETDGIRIKDRRVLVDVERGRTVTGWRPRRLGGGLGGRGYTKAMPARPAGPGSFGGPGGTGGGFSDGFRGGPRGGFGGRGGGFRGGPRGSGGFGGDRNGFGGGSNGPGGGGGRGGFGGERGGFGGNRGIGFQPNGFGGPPEGAPSGPRGRPGGGGGSYGGGGYGGGGGRSHEASGPSGRPSFDDNRGAGSGSNLEPVRPRDRSGYGGDRDRDRDRGDRDRDRDRDGGYGGGRRDDPRGTKREHDDGGYNDPRKRRY